jgi:hypothetical protein
MIHNECDGNGCEDLTHVLITMDVDDREPMVAYAIQSHAEWVKARPRIVEYVEATAEVEVFSMSCIGRPMTGAEATASAESDLASIAEEDGD